MPSLYARSGKMGTDNARSKRAVEDRVRGCLLGVAIGDALGAPFESLPPGGSCTRLEKLGGRIDDFAVWDYPAGCWSDDTGMSLALARGLIAHSEGGGGAETCIRKAFYEWVGSDEARRAGRTVRCAAKYGVCDVNAWSNGALMRTAPAAIYAHAMGLDPSHTAALAYMVAKLTHGHALATFPSVECTLALRSILCGDDRVPEAISDPDKLFALCRQFTPEEYAVYVEFRHRERLRETTGLFMWRQVFEGCLGMAGGSHWSQLPSFEEGILKVVNDSFDRDTAGAVAGAILGAYWGEGNIPRRWRLRVSKMDQIVEIAQRISEVGMQINRDATCSM
jgi:ADP-ribosyl-[dinitrogen reductase] hydrolase